MRLQHPTFFILGGWADQNAGGFVLSEIERNFRICVTEKTRKVANIRHKYPEWWLALVDYIGYGFFTESDRSQLREVIQLDDRWDKIILVNPIDLTRGFEV